MPAMRVNKHVVKLGYGRRKLLRDAGGAEIFQRPRSNVSNRTAAKAKLRKTIYSGGIAVQQADGIAQRPYRALNVVKPWGSLT